MNLREDSGKQELGRRIQSAIMASGQGSLSAFAGKLGWSRALIYQYVNGDVLVQLDRLQSIAEATGKPLEWFLAPDPNGCSSAIRELEEKVAELESTLGRAHAELAAERGARLEHQHQHGQATLELLRELCLAHRRSGNSQAMGEVGARWLAAAEAGRDARMAMDAQLQLGNAWFASGDIARAQSALEAALTAALELEDERAELSARQELVRTLQAAGRVDEARAQAECVAAAERWWPRWSGLVSLAALAEQTGHLNDAEGYIDAAQTVIEEPDAPEQHRLPAEAYLLSNRVNLLIARGRFQDALRANAEMLSRAEPAHLPDQMREGLLNAALCHLRLGNIAPAKYQLDRVRRWTALEPDQRAELMAQVIGSEALLLEGDPKGAKESARDAIERATAAGRGQLLAEAELALGRAYLADRQPDDARYHLEKCRDRAGRLQFKKVEMSAEVALARASLMDGTPAAIEHLAQLARGCAETGYEDLAAEAERLLGPGGK